VVAAAPAADPFAVLDTPDRVACGLSNVGNTCFMAAALQCLAHTPPLAAYFVAGREPRSSSKGKQGVLLDAFARLMREVRGVSSYVRRELTPDVSGKMWGSRSYFGVAPREVKTAVEVIAPIFRGWEQQDTHEFLRVVTDALHEALNTAPKLPGHTAPPGSDPKTLAEAAWRAQLARNQSFVHGTYALVRERASLCPHQVLRGRSV
jgi:ubiquitin carboxyl-terminal hydrolase 4/11/15